MPDNNDLLARAKERADTTPTPDEWGYRIKLAEEEQFVGRWRGETVDEENENRRIFLLWDEDDQPAFSRFYAALGREIDQASPNVGDAIVIYRGKDYQGQQGTGFSFGVAAEPSDKPLPDLPAATETAKPDGIPF